jgi:hypothetical protein
MMREGDIIDEACVTLDSTFKTSYLSGINFSPSSEVEQG